MPVLSPQKIKEIAARFGFSPSKQMGQNFLIDGWVLEKIVEAAELQKDDVVLEVGPGLGVLTEELAAAAGKVIAIEADKKLASALKGKFKNKKNLKIIDADFLRIDISKIDLGKHYKVVANLPYSITSDAIRKIMESDPAPQSAVLMVQKEVAERVCAVVGEMSLLALSVQYYGVPRFMFCVSRGSFWPVPKVDSAVIKIIFNKKQESRIKNQANFFRIARIGFSSPRKQLQNNLAAGLHISKEKAVEFLNRAKINPKARPEDLSVGDWERISS